jgi:hypothetical protein
MIDLSPQQYALFNKLSQDRQQNAQVLEKFSMRGIQFSATDKYSETAHFIYELLQNADDAKATQVRLSLKSNGLIFAHNGQIHFSLSDPAQELEDTKNQRLGHINAITSIGNSNKYETQIGQFGIGFKAVFQYTLTPEIYDPPFYFKIEKFIVPQLLTTDHPARKPGETLFYFPFNHPQVSAEQALHAIFTKLSTLTHPLLFLTHLTQISWFVNNQKQGCYSKQQQLLFTKTTPTKLPCQGQKITTHQELNQQIVSHHFLTLTRPISPSPQSSHQLSIAYLMTPQTDTPWQPIQTSYPAYCFFSTKEMTHLHFFVHAPFLLTENREGLKQDTQWNQTLIQAIAQLTADSLPILKAMGLLTEAFFQLLPISPFEFSDDNLFKPCYESVLTQLQSSQEALLPTQSGDYTTKKHAYLAENTELMNLLTATQLAQLVNQPKAQWVFPTVTAHQSKLREYVKNNLIVQEITQEKLLELITPTFIQSQTDDWLIQLYHYLLEKPDCLKHHKAWLTTRPILRLADGRITTAVDQNGHLHVYLPLENNSETEYPTVKIDFVQDEKSRQFLQLLGLEKPKEPEEIKYYILPRYQTSAEIETTVMQRDFYKLFNHFCHSSLVQKTHYINQLKNTAFCRARHNQTNNLTRLPPTMIYFPHSSLKQYFTHHWEVYFLDSDFYAPFYQTCDQNTLNHFFQELGIADKPRCRKINANLSTQQRQQIHQGQCTYDYSHLVNYSYDYDLEGLDNCLATINLKKSQILWNFSLQLIENHPKQEIFQGQYNWFYRRDRYHYFDAHFLVMLRKSAWLYNRAGKCVPPTQILVSELANHYETNTHTAKLLIEKLAIPTTPKKDSAYEQQYDLLTRELSQLATTTGKKTVDILNQFRRFLTNQSSAVNHSNHAQTDMQPIEPTDHFQAHQEDIETKTEIDAMASPNESPTTAYPAIDKEIDKEIDQESAFNKSTLLKAQLTQQLHEIERIEQLQAQLSQLNKYSMAWFNCLLELEYLLSISQKKSHLEKTIKFSQVEPVPARKNILILKNPSRHIFYGIEEMSDLSLQLDLGIAIKTMPIEIISVKDFTLQVRVKSPLNIQAIDWQRIQSAVIEIKNPTFILEKLITAFRQLPYAKFDNLQTHLTTSELEFIFGPPGTGKTTFLAQKKIIPLMATNSPLKVLVLTPTNQVADLLVKKIITLLDFSPQPPIKEHYREWLIRFGVTGDGEIEQAGLLPEKSAELPLFKKSVVVTTLARFLYDGFSNALLKNIHWEVIMFDEASMMMLAPMVYVLYQANQIKENVDNSLKKKKKCHLIVCGDPWQIQPVVLAEAWRQENIYTFIGLTDFLTADSYPTPFPTITLTQQFRSISPIGALFSHFSYQGVLTHHRQLADRRMLPKNHHPKNKSNKKKLTPLINKAITVIKYPLSTVDNLYKSHRFNGGSTYHLYSAIFTVELAHYLYQQLIKYSQEAWSIGIICPYFAQASLVEKMMATFFTVTSIKPRVQIMVGTLHHFQGDECDMILTLLVAPPNVSANSFINKKSLLNVAISRAKDYLILVMPDMTGLAQLERLEMILAENEEIKDQVQHLTAADVEQLLFEQANYIAANAVVTTHQRINIYTASDWRYEIRCEENALDIFIHS